MIKIRIPQKEITSFKTFCKQFSLHLDDQTGTRLRGNVLLNLMARAAGHDSYTALIIDAKTYGNGKMNWETLPNQLCLPIAAATGVPSSQCLSSLCFALMRRCTNTDFQNDVIPEHMGNRFYSDRANALLTSLMPALSDLGNAGENMCTQEVILIMSNYSSYCGLLNRSELSENSKSSLKEYITSFAEFDSQKPFYDQMDLEKSWGLNQAYMAQALRVTQEEYRHSIN